MRKRAGESLSRIAFVAGQDFAGQELTIPRRGRKLAQHGIHEGRSRTLAGALHYFDTLMQGSALRDAIEPAHLIESQAQRDENLEVESGYGLRGGAGDLVVEARTPAEDSHHEFGGECVIESGETRVRGGI